MHCGETAIDRLVISLQADVAATWLCPAPNSIEIGLAVFEHAVADLADLPYVQYYSNIGSSFRKLQDRPDDYYETLLASRYRTFKIRKQNWPRMTVEGS